MKVSFYFFKKNKNIITFICNCKKTAEEKKEKEEVIDLQNPSEGSEESEETEEEPTVKKTKVEKSDSEQSSFDEEKDSFVVSDSEEEPIKLQPEELKNLFGGVLKKEDIKIQLSSEDDEPAFKVKKKVKGKHDCPGYGIQYQFIISENTDAINLMTSPVFIWTVKIQESKSNNFWILEEVVDVETYNKKTELTYSMVSTAMRKTETSNFVKNSLSNWINNNKLGREKIIEANIMPPKDEKSDFIYYLKLTNVPINQIIAYLNYSMFLSTDYDNYVKYEGSLPIETLLNLKEDDFPLIEKAWNLIKRVIPQKDLKKSENPVITALLTCYEKILCPLQKDINPKDVVKEDIERRFSYLVIKIIESDTTFLVTKNPLSSLYEIVLAETDKSVTKIKDALFKKNNYFFNVCRVDDPYSISYVNHIKSIFQSVKYSGFAIICPNETRKIWMKQEFDLFLITIDEVLTKNNKTNMNLQNRKMLIFDCVHLLKMEQLIFAIEKTQACSPQLKDIFLNGSAFKPHHLSHNIITSLNQVANGTSKNSAKIIYTVINNTIEFTNDQIEIKTKKELIEFIKKNLTTTWYVFFPTAEVLLQLDLKSQVSNVELYTLNSWHQSTKQPSFSKSIVVTQGCNATSFSLLSTAAGSHKIFFYEDQKFNPTALNSKMVSHTFSTDIISRTISSDKQ